MVQSKFRVGGGYTLLTYKSTPLSYIDIIQETGPQPVAAPQAIQPIDAPYPIEIAFPAAIQAGTLSITFREQWNWEVWSQLFGQDASLDSSSTKSTSGSGPQDLLEVFKAQLQASSLDIVKVITDPKGNQRVATYSGLVIVNVAIDETINIGTMTLPKQIQFMYTQRTEKYYTVGSTGTTVSGNTYATFS